MTQLFNKFYIPEDVGISSVAIAQFLKECDEIIINCGLFILFAMIKR